MRSPPDLPLPHAMQTRDNTIIIYGSYGYTGQLITAECRSRNLKVILSGRRSEDLRAQSLETGYPFEVATLSDRVALRNLLLKGSVLIHCAGPFQFTSKAIIEMCIDTHTHYTDISGEHQVFEMLAGYDNQAKKVGITVMPGTGFDVVPSDCLAVFLKQKLPVAMHLELAFNLSGGGSSRGTAKTMIEGLGQGSVIRKNGKLLPVPLGEGIKLIDFGPFKVKCLRIPWGDISTAWTSTGIPDIAVYMGTSPRIIALAKLSRYFNWFLKWRSVKNLLRKRIENQIAGPEPEKRNAGKSFLWGKAWDDAGNSYTATLETMNGYSLTARTSVLIAEKILKRDFKKGYQTPGTAYGPDLILEIENTYRRVL
jgi:short subunit dehydrogenase-like uncharacterized protein